VLRSLFAGARVVVAAGTYPAAEARRVAGRPIPVVEVPPGADPERFRPLSAAQRRKARHQAGLPADGRLVLGLSRLVPRKGMDVLIEAAARLAPDRPDLVVAIAGTGRDRARLERLARRSGAPVRFLGAVPDADLPGLYGAADVFCMLCRSRWGGLEQEGFGVVFLEAAACGVPQVAGASGGAAEAVAHGETGFVVDNPRDPREAAAALARLLDDADLRAKLGEAGRRRVEEHFSYDRLAASLDRSLQALV
jgi:phosphatidylinositol alpha-1,6-mannosyltransferase